MIGDDTLPERSFWVKLRANVVLRAVGLKVISTANFHATQVVVVGLI